MKLNNLSLFLKIIEKGSLAAAGRELGLSATTVSERLAALESHYGVTLINRTTRSIRLTEEGRVLFDGAKQVLDEVDDLDSRLREGAQSLSGLIRISAPSDLGNNTIKKVVDEFLADNPKTTIELLLTDGYINIVDEGVDIAVRFGNLADSSLRVRSLGTSPRIVCATPEYLEKHGTPKTPEDLQQHNCLVMRFGAHLDNIWRFGSAANSLQVVVSGDRIANDSRLVHQWGLESQGIMFKSLLDIRPSIESGALVSLLEEHQPATAPIQMVFPPSRSQPRRVREFADKLAAAFI